MHRPLAAAALLVLAACSVQPPPLAADVAVPPAPAADDVAVPHRPGPCALAWDYNADGTVEDRDTLTYDEAGRAVGIVYDNGDDGVIDKVVKDVLDDAGHVTFRTEEIPGGSGCVYTTTATWDDAGRPASVRTAGPACGGRPAGTTWVTAWTWLDDTTALVDQTGDDQLVGRDRVRADADGHLLWRDHVDLDDGGKYRAQEDTWDDRGRNLSSLWYWPDGTAAAWHINTWRDDGQLEEQLTYAGLYRYDYDAGGNLTVIEAERAARGVVDLVITADYACFAP